MRRLYSSIESLRATAADPTSFEVLVRVDDDDQPTQDFLCNGAAPRGVNLSVIRGPRGRGYLDLHLMCNELAARSKGDFLFLWNDDAEMVTRGWDDVLRSHLVDPPRVYKPTSAGHQRNIFPVLRRSVYEAMGHFSESALNDFYTSTIAKRCGIEAPVAIDVRHDHPFQGGSNADQTYLDAVEACKVCKHDDKNARIMACMDEDVERVKRLLGG